MCFTADTLFHVFLMSYKFQISTHKICRDRWRCPWSVGTPRDFWRSMEICVTCWNISHMCRHQSPHSSTRTASNPLASRFVLNKSWSGTKIWRCFTQILAENKVTQCMYVFNKNLFNCMSTYIPSDNNFPQRNSKLCLVMLETLFMVTIGLVSG